MQFTASDIWAHMGAFARVIVAVLAVMSVASVVVVVERAALFGRERRATRAFAARMGAILARGEIAKAAADDVGDEIGYLGRVIRAGLSAYRVTSVLEGQGRNELVFESVARALERQAARETEVLKRGIALLATVASTAPFVGLLGTVMGIINAFQSMAASGSGGLGTVSAGIAEALATTAVGLGVAIVAVVAYNVLQGWVDARAVDISEASNELLDVVQRELADVRAVRSEVEAAE
jgi:biopolymer transport protein ExbB/TolQ